MSDATIRELERAVARREPGARERLEREWLRAGRGWHGERLLANERGNMAAEGERLVYRWLVAPLAALEIPLVYVPGGEVPCEHDANGGLVRRLEPRFDGADCARVVECPACGGTNRVKVAPFYVGRFPVTLAEWFAFEDARQSDYYARAKVNAVRAGEAHRGGLHRPAVHVAHADALAFCAWAGLRLPTPSEWQWAALGRWETKIDEHVREHGEHKTFVAEARMRRHDHLRAGLSRASVETAGDARATLAYDLSSIVFYPWGPTPPTAEECVASDERYRGRSAAPVVVQESDGQLGARTGRVVSVFTDESGSLVHEPRRMAPARPKGASWCGAHDMVGHVWQWRSDGTALGGSFRTEGPGVQFYENMRLGRALFENNGVPWRDDFARDDIGFRVALDAPPQD